MSNKEQKHISLHDSIRLHKELPLTTQDIIKGVNQWGEDSNFESAKDYSYNKHRYLLKLGLAPPFKSSQGKGVIGYNLITEVNTIFQTLKLSGKGIPMKTALLSEMKENQRVLFSGYSFWWTLHMLERTSKQGKTMHSLLAETIHLKLITEKYENCKEEVNSLLIDIEKNEIAQESVKKYFEKLFINNDRPDFDHIELMYKIHLKKLPYFVFDDVLRKVLIEKTESILNSENIDPDEDNSLTSFVREKVIFQGENNVIIDENERNEIDELMNNIAYLPKRKG